MSSSSQAGDSWISAFCSLVGHEYFAEVSEDFIEDDFNLTGLQSQVPMYKEALEMILDVEPETDEYTGDEDDEDEASLNSDDASLRDNHNRGGGGPTRLSAAERRHNRIQSDYSVIESSAEMLYGLIHQRFITSRQGIQQMLEKYEIGHFGSCPRVYCRGAKVLPVGTSDIPNHDTVKLFCPACLDVYAPPNSRFQSVDGAFFGTTFGCLFFMTFPELDVAGTRLLENGGASTPHAIPPPFPANGEGGADGSGSKRRAAAAAAGGGGVWGKYASVVINGVAAHNLAPGLGQGSIFEPRIFGFRVSEFANSGPRMKWLRQKPGRVGELDEVAIWERSHGGAGVGQFDAEEDEDEDDEDEDDEDDEEGGDENGDEQRAAPPGQSGGGDGILDGDEAVEIQEDDEEEEEDVGEALGDGGGGGGLGGGAAVAHGADARDGKTGKTRQRDEGMNGELG